MKQEFVQKNNISLELDTQSITFKLILTSVICLSMIYCVSVYSDFVY